MNSTSPNQERRLEAGQGLAEYALILVLVGIAVIAVLSLLGPNIRTMYCQLAATIDSNLPTTCMDGNITVVHINYTPSSQTVRLVVAYNNSGGTPVTLSTSPGGAMKKEGGGNLYSIMFNHACPCDVTVSASSGDSTIVEVS